MAMETVTCSECRHSHGVTHCDSCQAAVGENGVWLQLSNMPWDLAPSGAVNRYPVLCVPCARGERGPVDFVALVLKPQQRYPGRTR